MEVALFTALTGIWWVSSITVLLPVLFLLKFSKYFRDKWFAVLYVRLLKSVFEPKLLPLRKKAFDVLKENLPERDASVPLEILEIGVGSGANLQFYPDNSHLIALDMNPNFGAYFHENQMKYPQVTYKETVTAMAENMHQIDDSSIDVVISTYVLCSVKSVEEVLSEVKRVLKPGGKFLFLEHIAFPSSWSLTVQRMATPIWKIYFDGCCLTRNIDESIRNAGFSEVVSKKASEKSLLLFIRPQVCGIATK